MAFSHRIRSVTAVLGPTNTGKTHLAIERMLGHQSGMIGLPLRLLAREVYDKIVARVGPSAVALVTGEEKIKPDNPRFWVSTVEAMPRSIDVDFLAIDEIQLAADPDRGHVFTDRLLHARGRSETLLLGAGTMREAISELIPDANFISRPRLSKISYSGQKKITRLPKRSAIVAFSAAEVYSIAELIRRQLGGAAVVLGALSPRTRNAQVALYQSGDVDYLVATDAIGMGLNLDVDHVAFAAVRKFDGHVTRNLTPGELGQIAGRAGRHVNDGTFGVTADVEPFDADLIERLENHNFDTVRMLQWRNRNLEFSTLDRLRESLKELPTEQRLQRVRMADDVTALEALSSNSDIADRAIGTAAVTKLWEVCQVPDYRKISSQNHAELVAQLYGFLMSPEEQIPEDWFAKQVALADRTDGDIDTLATRIAHIRTWTFVSNRAEWLKDPVHWQQRTRAIEDSLSDALHEQLAQRFVDRKTSALMKGLRDKEEMTADIAADGAVTVENHYVGRLKGFRFWPDTEADATGVHGKAARGAAAHVLSKELGMRARRVAAAKPDAFKITRQGRIQWRSEEIARLEPGDDALRPTVVLIADDHLSPADREKVQIRLDAWVGEVVAERLKPLLELKNAEDVTGLARGIAFRLVENFGIVRREEIADEMRQLDQPSRGQLRKYGVRFGAFNIFLPPLLKPAPAELTLSLWALKHASSLGFSLEQLPEPPRAGLTSAHVAAGIPPAFYRAAGYHVCGPRAIRVDMLERLADTIRPLLAWRGSEAGQTPPRGSSGDGGFMVTPEMMSILGCSSAELSAVLNELGFRSEQRPAPRPKPVMQAAPVDISPAPVDPSAEPPANEIEAEPTIASEPVLASEADVLASPPAIEIASKTETETETPAIEEPPAETAPHTAASEIAVETATLEPVASPEADGSVGEISDASVAGTPPEEAVSDDKTSSDESEHVPMIDVWRPRRRQREGQTHGRPRHHRRPEASPAASSAAEGENMPRAENGEASRPQRHGGNRDQRQGQQGGPRRNDRGGGDRRDRNNRPQGETPASTSSSAPQERRDDRPHRDRSGDRKDGGGEHRRSGPPRDDHRRDDRRRQDDRSRQQVRSAAPQRKGGVDPDSPFAALSALKQQLESKTKTPT